MEVSQSLSAGLCHRNNTGFSLIEIVLALGIISFAVVAIMGLLPVAMKSAQESQRETRAALIAQQVYSDLLGPSAKSAFIATGTNFSSAADRTSVNLQTSGTYQVSYDEEGRPLGAGPVSNGTFLVDVTVLPNTPIPGVAKVQTIVSTPSAAPSSARSKYVFLTLANQTQ